MVYRYYYFNRLKQRYPHMSFYELMHWTWRWNFLGPPPEPKSLYESRGGSKLRSLFFSRLKSKEESVEKGRASVANQPIVGSKSELYSMDFPSIRTDDSAIIGDQDLVNVLADDFMGQEQPKDEYFMDLFSADLLMSYGDFPNTLSEQPVMVTAQFPTMIGRNSYSTKPTKECAIQDDFSPPNEGDTGLYPSIIKDDVFD
jgi:hypothetical protein